MFKNYLKVSLRNLVRHKAFSLINISGLAIGIACCIVIFMFVKSETGYDTYHENGADLYRLTLDTERLSNGEIWTGATSSVLWAPAMKREFPEIVEACRIIDEDNTITLRAGNQEFEEDNIVFADKNVFRVFTWPLVSGDPATALVEPYTLVINEDVVARYFGDEDPVGKFFVTEVNRRDENGQIVSVELQFKVTGVMKNLPFKSHLKPDFVVSLKTQNDFLGGDVESGTHPVSWFWRGRIAHNYVLLKEGFPPEELEAKMPAFLDKYVGDATTTRGYQYHPYLQHVSGIHLEGDVSGTFERGGDKNQIYLFAIIAVFILLIACINFMNLSTARSSVRSREIGVRKVVGANRKSLIRQFMGESVLTSLLGTVLALGIVWLINPIFYSYINREFYLAGQDIPIIIAGIVLIMAVVGLISGSYPALFLSGFQPVFMLRQASGPGSKAAYLRKTLVVTQFAITVFFIFGSLTVYNQLRYMNNQELGFKSDQVLVVPPSVSGVILDQAEAYRNDFVQYSGIKRVSYSSTLPGAPAGGDIWGEEGKSGEEGVSLDEFAVDFDFIDLYDLELVAGRAFDKNMGTDAAPEDPDGPGYVLAGIVNEAAVRRYGWSSPEEALGKHVVRDPVSNDFTCNVIGVVRDFHFTSLRSEIEPMILFINPNYNSSRRYASFEIAPRDVAGTVDFIKGKIQPLLNEVSFEYFFVDENFASLYEADQRLVEIFGYISALTILVASLGLLGLASFAAERRTKEVGIRKVLGGTVSGIVKLLSMDFVKLVLLATLIATPAAYYFMNRWLEEFAYRFEIGVGTFLLSGILAIMVALITVSTQALKAALTNPAESLRYE